MLPILTAAQMRACDNDTIHQKNISSQTLMERAAHAAIEVLQSEPTLPLNEKTRLVILCGSGNNGGDGFAMARFLFDAGYDATACYAGQWLNGQPDTAKMSIECARQYTLWQNAGGRTLDALPSLRPACTLVIDALFGIGLCRDIEGTAAAWIEAINHASIPVLSIDLPSGVSADTGAVLGCAVRATVTATIACLKPGLLLYPAAECVGKLRVCDIGITTEALDSINAHLVTPEDIAPLLDRPAYANKGTFGRVLVVGGFPGMSGAPYFAAKTAYRAGTGLVELLTAEANRIPLQTLLPEAVLTAFDPKQLPTERELSFLLDRADSVVLGCGLGQSEAARKLIEAILRLCRKPLVIDADGLNLLAAFPALQQLVAARQAPTVLTPHLGEVARLTSLSIADIAADLFATADALSKKYNAVCVLKDARTVISDGSARYVQAYGNSGMATGGSGDCLAGLIGSLLAQHRHKNNLSHAHVAALGVLLHAMAGDVATAKLGQHALMASDLVDAVGNVLHDVCIKC